MKSSYSVLAIFVSISVASASLATSEIYSKRLPASTGQRVGDIRVNFMKYKTAKMIANKKFNIEDALRIQAAAQDLELNLKSEPETSQWRKRISLEQLKSEIEIGTSADLRSLDVLNTRYIAIKKSIEEYGVTKESYVAMRVTAQMMLKAMKFVSPEIVEKMGISKIEVLNFIEGGTMAKAPTKDEGYILTSDASGTKGALHPGGESQGVH